MPKPKESQTGRATRKSAGVFYTPEHIVNYILDRTLGKHDIVTDPAPKVLDPACGSGNFLVAAYDVLWGKLNENLILLQRRYAKEQYSIKSGNIETCMTGNQYWQPENLHYHIINCCLYGADVDEAAVSVAKSRLQEKAIPQTVVGLVDDNLVVCDSLIKWEGPSAAQVPDSGSEGISYKLTLAEFWQQKFDYIVGNPPYISFGLNRVGKIPIVQSDYLRHNYPYSAQYKLSYYALFFERSIKALKLGGYLGFITPDSYLLGRYYSKIREYILETCRVQEITLASSNVFAGVLVGIPAITILQKADNDCSTAVVTVTRLGTDGVPVTRYQYEQNYFMQQVYKRFRLFFHARDKEIIDKLEQTPCLLKDITKIRTGMRSLTVQAEIKSKTRQGNTWMKGLISSGQIRPFCLAYQGDWLDVNPAKLNKGGWEAAIIAGPKIFMRQTGDSLIAAIDRSGLYHLNNIHSLTVLQDGVSLEYLVCILNSRLMNYYYHTVTLEKGRAMAQVDIETVEKLPLRIDKQCQERLALLGIKLSKLAAAVYLGEAEETADSAVAADELGALYNEMNTLVYKIYGLTESEITYIEQANAENTITKFRKLW
ncbi:Eco57I restriction-modification methylase domain-containing protein [Sporomusa malonica]|uniref:site-specific DNA-methyltransferase (adenine-specific) n=1 Tax=Sporomusa malonica TaxID=112901 RepID=A0A1W2BHD6_9FIRM|nr:N-6 DNA methylase [Sporomusa malonica]SMC72291.1 TaqI-like C-terminal specificity domain-containing protein [Sporomusa malonica]